MGIADVRKAFDAAGQGKVRCTAARLKYEVSDGYEYQRLEFDGVTVVDNKPFSVRSDRIRAHASLIEAAGQVARDMLTGPANAQNTS